MNEHEFIDIIQTYTIDFKQCKHYETYKSPTDNLKFLRNYKHEKTRDSILFYAARCSNLNLIKLLFQYNFDFNQINIDGKNILHEVFFLFYFL
jgi:hypothetical protein